MEDPEPTEMYRYESRRYSIAIDAEMEIYGVSQAKLVCQKLYVTSKTPKGYWIGWFKWAKDHWVSNTSRKRYAHPTKEAALVAYTLRKKAYVKHCEARLARAKEDLSLASKKEGLFQ